VATRVSICSLARTYLEAKRAVLAAGYGAELVHQMCRERDEITEQRLLEQSAWVILCSGMREGVIRRLFEPIGECFFRWRSSAIISSSADHCFRTALSIFNHPAKIRAIIEVSCQINEAGFNQILTQIRCDPLTAVRQFPFIGPVTSYHLAKNIGVNLAKPDRHLRRIAEACGYDCVQALCGAIASYVGDAVDLVDTVLWRYASISPGYIYQFKEAVGMGSTRL
jgi:hypothetical protein